jgi:ribonuclease P protein component
MFSKNNRLKKKKDFERVFKQGQSIKKDLLLFKYTTNDLDSPRIGIVISKKTCSRASERNLIKRRIRGIIRQRIDNIKNLDIVIVVLKGINKSTGFNQLELTIDNILEKI